MFGNAICLDFFQDIQIPFPGCQFKKDHEKTIFFKKATFLCENFSQGLTYVNFFLGFHFSYVVILPCYI